MGENGETLKEDREKTEKLYAYFASSFSLRGSRVPGSPSLRMVPAMVVVAEVLHMVLSEWLIAKEVVAVAVVAELLNKAEDLHDAVEVLELCSSMFHMKKALVMITVVNLFSLLFTDIDGNIPLLLRYKIVQCELQKNIKVIQSRSVIYVLSSEFIKGSLLGMHICAKVHCMPKWKY